MAEVILVEVIRAVAILVEAILAVIPAVLEGIHPAPRLSRLRTRPLEFPSLRFRVPDLMEFACRPDGPRHHGPRFYASFRGGVIRGNRFSRSLALPSSALVYCSLAWASTDTCGRTAILTGNGNLAAACRPTIPSAGLSPFRPR